MSPSAKIVSLRPIEVWGGLECSLARLGDEYSDQTILSGHEHRLEDLDAFAALGIKAIRYPVLWERIAPDRLDRADWRWTDERLNRLRALDVRPIATLLHHGSGPRHTDLTQPDFAVKFAAFAARVAERYPWLDTYTPINEPLTTARFSGLYGVWYPHARDHKTCLRILINQIKGTRLAMRAIRAVNPDARLIQTEDLGKAYSTPRLAYQAAFENERRWLSLDLLTGRVDRDHPLWPYLVSNGFEKDLEELRADPCPPDVIGIDHYLTSERFLDERVERYPGVGHTDNGRDRYIDIEAVRVVAEGITGLETLIEEAWQRYGLPVAASEVHNGSSREEQLRWLKECWDSAHRLRTRGIDIRSVTAWALLGSHHWNSLLTRQDGYYESGVFDVRSPRPRPTALAHMVRDLARTGDASHPVLGAPGWWHRQDRFTWTPVRCCPYTGTRRVWSPPSGSQPARPILITGGNGTLAQALARLCVVRGLPYRLLSRRDLDAAEPERVAAAIARHRPWAVVNAAGFTDIDRAETAQDRCWRDNVQVANSLARTCAAHGIPLLSFSSDLVFGDGPDRPWDRPRREADATSPLGVYGRTKAEAEQAILSLFPQALVIRSGPVFGPWDDRNAAVRALRAATEGRGIQAAEDVTVSPTYLPDLVNVALDLLMDQESGVWHLASAGAATWADFIREIVRRAGLNPRHVHGLAGERLGWIARRPANSALESSRGAVMPTLDGAMARFLDERAANPLPWTEPLGLISA